MKFYGLLLIEKGRIDVSKYFKAGDELIFLYDDEKHCFAAQTKATFPDDKIGETIGEFSRVMIDGTVEVPWWVMQTTQTLLFGDILGEKAEGFLVSPKYSWMTENIYGIYLVPVDGLDGKIPQKKKKKEGGRSEISEFQKPGETVSLPDLSKDMLKASFGPDFDTEVGRPKVAR